MAFGVMGQTITLLCLDGLSGRFSINRFSIFLIAGRWGLLAVKKLLPIILLGLLTACGSDGWFGKAGDPVLPGERKPILLNNNDITPDATIADAPVIIPPAAANPSWPMAGGYADHVMQHLALAKDPLKMIWQSDIGQGSSRDGFLLTQPVAVGGRVFTIDVGSRVTAFDIKSGAEIWRVDLTPDAEDSNSIASGGLATDGVRVYAATGLAELVALDPADGKIMWRQPVSSPLRSAPTLSDGKIFIVPVDNHLMALSASDGKLLWMHEGLNESASLLGGASPAVADGAVIAAFSTGDLIAFDVEKGRPLWTENLARIRRGDLMGGLTSVQALPVVHDHVVYAIGHSNRALAIDLQSGERIWDLPVGGTRTPWVTDNYLYTIDNDNRAIAVELARGLVKWVTPIGNAADGKKLRFTAPVMAGGRLLFGDTAEKLWAISPQDGKVIGTYSLPGPVSVAPIVVDGTLLVLTDNGKLAAFQ